MAALLEDGSVLLTPLDCGLICLTEDDIRAWWRRNAFWHPGLLPVLAVMRSSAANAALVSPPHRGVVPVVPNLARSGSEEALSMMTVHEAAMRLQISERAVVKAISKGHLDGRQIDGSRRWEITSASVGRYVPRSRPSEGEAMSEADFQAVKAELLELQAEIEQIEADVRGLAVA